MQVPSSPIVTPTQGNYGRVNSTQAVRLNAREREQERRRQGDRRQRQVKILFKDRRKNGDRRAQKASFERNIKRNMNRLSKAHFDADRARQQTTDKESKIGTRINTRV